MQKQTDQKNRQDKTPLHTLIGAPTKAKASGLAFSLAALLPAIFSFIFVLIIHLAGVTKNEDYAQSSWYLYISYILPQLSFACVAYAWLRYTNTPAKSAIKAQKCHLKYFLVALLLQIGLFSFSQLNTLFLRWLARFGYQDSGIALPQMQGAGFFGVLLVVAVLPAILEETFFRGVLLSGMNSFSQTARVLVCGALFALYHQNPAQTVYQFCCGALFALVTIRAGSILPTVLSHFVNNAAILTLTKFGVSTFSTPVSVSLVVVSVVCLVGTLVYLLWMDKPFHSSANKSDALKTDQKHFFLCALVGIATCALTWGIRLFTGM